MRTKTLLTIIVAELAGLVLAVVLVALSCGGGAGVVGVSDTEIEAGAQTIREERRDEIDAMDPDDVSDLYLDERTRADIDDARDAAGGEIYELLREFEDEFGIADDERDPGADTGDR